jgi:hypothetical protein
MKFIHFLLLTIVIIDMTFLFQSLFQGVESAVAGKFAVATTEAAPAEKGDIEAAKLQQEGDSKSFLIPWGNSSHIKLE